MVYSDHILIYSTLTTHTSPLLQGLQHLADNQLFVKPEMCLFHVPTISFLGYIRSAGGACIDPSKTQAVVDWRNHWSICNISWDLPTSTDVSFVISALLQPPFTCLLPDAPCIIHLPTTAAPQACFTSPSILKYPDPSLPFMVEVDASDTGVGAVLSKHHGSPVKQFPRAFFEKTLGCWEDLWCGKLFTMEVAFEELRHRLDGAQHPCVVLTNHKNMEHMQGAKRLSIRQAR